MGEEEITEEAWQKRALSKQLMVRSPESVAGKQRLLPGVTILGAGKRPDGVPEEKEIKNALSPGPKVRKHVGPKGRTRTPHGTFGSGRENERVKKF